MKTNFSSFIASELQSLELNVITTEDVEEAIKRTKPSASHLLDKYKKWQEEFGSTWILIEKVEKIKLVAEA